jgi:hypothetical protein
VQTAGVAVPVGEGVPVGVTVGDVVMEGEAPVDSDAVGEEVLEAVEKSTTIINSVRSVGGRMAARGLLDDDTVPSTNLLKIIYNRCK